MKWNAASTFWFGFSLALLFEWIRCWAWIWCKTGQTEKVCGLEIFRHKKITTVWKKTEGEQSTTPNRNNKFIVRYFFVFLFYQCKKKINGKKTHDSNWREGDACRRRRRSYEEVKKNTPFERQSVEWDTIHRCNMPSEVKWIMHICELHSQFSIVVCMFGCYFFSLFLYSLIE